DSLRILVRGLLQAAFIADLTPTVCAQLARQALQQGAAPFLLSGFGVLVLVVGVQLASTKMKLPGRIRLDPSRLSSTQRIKGLAGQNGAAAMYAIALLGLIGWMLWSELGERLPTSLALVHSTVERSGSEIRSAIMSLVWRVTAITVSIGVIDMVRQH